MSPVDPKPTPAGQDSPLAYLDLSFLESEDGRPIRILAEYLQPLHAFRRHRVHDTIAFFGSARVREDGPRGRFYRDARELARGVTEWSQSIQGPGRRFLVCTGGGPGIMEAANRGAADAGGRSIGLNIGLPHEQRPNGYITPDLSFQFHYFFMRKLWFAYLARALVVFPGGFGTLDELFEILTLSQTQKLDRKVPVLLYGPEYWRKLVSFDLLVEDGMIEREDLRLFQFVDTPTEALRILQTMLGSEARPESPSIAKSKTPDDPVPKP